MTNVKSFYLPNSKSITSTWATSFFERILHNEFVYDYLLHFILFLFWRYQSFSAFNEWTIRTKCTGGQSQEIHSHLNTVMLQRYRGVFDISRSSIFSLRNFIKNQAEPNSEVDFYESLCRKKAKICAVLPRLTLLNNWCYRNYQQIRFVSFHDVIQIDLKLFVRI